jgi:hypothetical protein
VIDVVAVTVHTVTRLTSGLKIVFEHTILLTRCYLLFYCTSYRSNMCRALLCPSSGAHDYNVDYRIGRFVLGLL